jgi:hypothetical protein
VAQTALRRELSAARHYSSSPTLYKSRIEDGVALSYDASHLYLRQHGRSRDRNGCDGGHVVHCFSTCTQRNPSSRGQLNYQKHVKNVYHHIGEQYSAHSLLPYLVQHFRTDCTEPSLRVLAMAHSLECTGRPHPQRAFRQIQSRKSILNTPLV